MDEDDRKTAPPTPGSAEGMRDTSKQSEPATPEHTPGQAEGQRDAPEAEGQS